MLQGFLWFDQSKMEDLNLQNLVLWEEADHIVVESLQL